VAAARPPLLLLVQLVPRLLAAPVCCLDMHCQHQLLLLLLHALLLLPLLLHRQWHPCFAAHQQAAGLLRQQLPWLVLPAHQQCCLDALVLQAPPLPESLPALL
jgi:hypothetical protein